MYDAFIKKYSRKTKMWVQKNPSLHTTVVYYGIGIIGNHELNMSLSRKKTSFVKLIFLMSHVALKRNTINKKIAGQKTVKHTVAYPRC